ncbi:hypothetical protein JNM05_01375 [bacterium]|nr:hypothetical protein [bacterium]
MDHLGKIRQFLISSGVEFKEIRHEPTYTSADSALARGEELKTGGKAIVMKVSDNFKLFVITADRKVDSNKIKRYFEVRKIRFATPHELMQTTGLVAGSVPPFGRPILDFELFIDRSIAENEVIAFNAGSLTDSIVMRVADYLKVANGNLIDFSV